VGAPEGAMIFAGAKEAHRSLRRSHPRARPLTVDQTISTSDRRSPGVDAACASVGHRWRSHDRTATAHGDVPAPDDSTPPAIDRNRSDVGREGHRRRSTCSRRRRCRPSASTDMQPTPTVQVIGVDEKAGDVDHAGTRHRPESARRRHDAYPCAPRIRSTPGRRVIGIGCKPVRLDRHSCRCRVESGRDRVERRRDRSAGGHGCNPAGEARARSGHARADAHRACAQGTWQSNPSSNRQPLAGRGSP